MIYYKIPTDLVSIEELRQLQGTDGSFLFPIQDINGEWIVSTQEWDSKEFQWLKDKFPEIADGFKAIETEAAVLYLPDDPIYKK